MAKKKTPQAAKANGANDAQDTDTATAAPDVTISTNTTDTEASTRDTANVTPAASLTSTISSGEGTAQALEAAKVGLDPVVEANIEAVQNSSTVEFGAGDDEAHARNHDPLHKPVTSKEEIHPTTKHVATRKKSAGSSLAREEAEQRQAAAEQRRAEAEPVVDITQESANTKRKLEEISVEAAVNDREAVEFDNEKLCEGNPNTALSAEHAIKKARTEMESDMKQEGGRPEAEEVEQRI